MSLNRLLKLRKLLIYFNWLIYRYFWGMDIDRSVQFSLSVRFDRTNPKGIHIGSESYLAFDCAVLSHDALRNKHVDTWIGKRCFIGARVIILPGVRIGDCSVIGAGSVVAKDVPAHSIAVGNPARVVRQGIALSRDHVLVSTEAPGL